MFDELHRFGFIEGENLTIDWREYGPRVDLGSEYAALEPWPMSFMPAGVLQYARHSRRRQRLRSSAHSESPLLLRLGVMNHDQ